MASVLGFAFDLKALNSADQASYFFFVLFLIDRLDVMSLCH